MFDLNFDKLDNYRFSMKYIALTNLFSAWYMLLNLKTSMPNVDATLARIYFSEYGVNVTDLPDKDISEMALEYEQEIKTFFMRCQLQRCENIIDRFGKVGCDTRLQHCITLPPKCKEFFLEILNLNKLSKLENSSTKETQCLDSLLSSMIVNNTFTVDSIRNGVAKGSLDSEYNISPEEFSSYTDIIHNKIVGLYRPSSELDETHEDWGTKFRRIIDYIKTLVFMVTRDVAFNEHILYLAADMYDDKMFDRNVAFRDPFINLGIKDDLFLNASKVIGRAVRTDIAPSIQSMVSQYGSLNIEHAICLFHNTNASLDTSKLKQSRDSDAFKFLCCQEYIYMLDSMIKKELLTKYKPTAV